MTKDGGDGFRNEAGHRKLYIQITWTLGYIKEQSGRWGCQVVRTWFWRILNVRLKMRVMDC